MIICMLDTASKDPGQPLEPLEPLAESSYKRARAIVKQDLLAHGEFFEPA